MGRYLPGLWERDLLRHLVWQSDPHHGRFQLESPPRKLPSWSWIASLVPVRWPALHHENLESDTQVLESYCTHNDMEQLGDGESAGLTLSAPFVTMPLGAPVNGTFELSVEGAGATKVEFIPDATAAALQLRAGDTLFCAVMITYMREDAWRWVALALRPVMEMDVRGSVVDVYRNRPRGGRKASEDMDDDSIASDGKYHGQVLAKMESNAIDSMGHVYSDWVGDLSKRDELTSRPNWFDTDLRLLMEVDETALAKFRGLGRRRFIIE